MRELWRRLKWFAHRDQFDRELDEEMRHHLAMQTEQLGGIEKANRQFGNTVLWKEDSRAMWTGVFWERVAQDIRYGLRMMRANKLFTAMAVLSLALGIGANTAIYSFMDAIMIRAIPVAHPEQLAIVNWHSRTEAKVITNHTGTSYSDPGGGSTSPNYPYQAFEFLRDNNQVFSTLFGYARAGRLNVVIDGQAELGDGEYVTGGYFSGLGVNPAAGRLIGADDDRTGATPVVVIAYRLWQKHFAGNPDALGKSVVINGKPFLIAGVAAPEFFGVNLQSAVDVYIPAHDLPLVDSNRYGDVQARFTDNHFYWIEMMGRLKPGVRMAQAQVALATQFQQWVAGTAKTAEERSTLPSLWLQEGGSGVDSLRRQYSKPLFILMTMVGLILAIACANIANLLLARASARRREMAVRLSLGAGRMRVMQQLLTESVMLSLCGGLLGIFIGAAGIRGLTWLLANGRDNFTLHAEMDGRVLVFTLLVAVATGILFGFAPAIQSTRVDVTPALKETRAGNSQGRTRRFGIPFGISHVLVVAQIAISLLLVAAAGLFVRTLGNLNAVDVGFNRENVLLFNLNAAQAGYPDGAIKSFYADLQRRFRQIPGVQNVTLTHMPMVANWTSSTAVAIPGYAEKSGKRPSTSVTQVGPQFFETMQIPILAGRAIDERDREGSQQTAVVNEVFAKKYFSGQSPIGRHFQFGGGDKAVDMEIVGLAKSARYNSLKHEIPPVAYMSYLQGGKTRPVEWMYFELRTAGDPMALAGTVRKIVHDVAPQVPVAEMSTQARRIDETIVQERMFADLCTCFGVLALMMACVGLYGMMAYAVARRTGEIGIRMALGAERRGIVLMVLREVLVLGITGLVIGLVAVWQTTVYIKSLLFGLTPGDPLTLAGAVAILLACAILAGYAPALRASRIDPMAALRCE
jgi:macrolide transport system ATP-binding/permease protein